MWEDSVKHLLLNLRRWHKNSVLMVSDVVLIYVSLCLAFYLRLGIFPIRWFVDLFPLFAVVATTAVSAFWLLGTYNHLLRAISMRIANTLAVGLGIAAAMIAIYGYFDQSLLIPRSIPMIFWVIAFALIGASRMAGRWLYRNLVGLTRQSHPIMVYGAGEAGTHVSAVLDNSREFSLVGFIDDDPALWGNRIRGRKVFRVDALHNYSKRYENLRVLICIANITGEEKRAIIEKLQAYPVQVLTIPPLPEIVAGRGDVSDIQEVKIEELLGRAPVPPIEHLFGEAIENKAILVTGGGGSIGSEICRQLLSKGPSRLTVVESSEFALYSLERSISEILATEQKNTQIEYRLGSVTDEAFLDQVFRDSRPEIVYHAAAYKHVPIIEGNILAGILNNIIGTYLTGTLAEKYKCDRFILVSTDKAVRPTNVMGATKRVAELVVQAMAKKETKTLFAMVRFGNVLGSSGSVIPLFRKQITNGGPVTVTHPEVTRYFMTIPEAAQLVIQAGSMARGSDVFLLDMGKPILIERLARLMIQLSGKTTRDAKNPRGEIEIQFSGLRPGEKLYEELLVTDNARETEHPKIMMAEESSISLAQMQKMISTLFSAVEKQDTETGFKVLESLVEGYSR